MKTNLMRVIVLLVVLALAVSGVFAQEEAATSSVNTFTFVLVILGGGIGIVGLLGMAMRDTNGNDEPKSE